MHAGPVRASGVRWRVVAWITLASLVAYVLRFNLSVAGPAMMRDLGLTEAQLGIVLSAFAWSYGIFQIPGGMFGERVGPHRAMTVMFIAWFATTALMALVPRGMPVMASVTLLVLLRAAQGIAQAPVFPVTSGGSMFAWLPPASWGLANSLGSAGLTVGAALTGPGIAWLVVAVGWRLSFLVVAPIALVLAVIWWRDYRDDPATHRSVNAAELAIIRSGREAHHTIAHGERARWTALLANRDLLCITLSYFCSNYLFYLFFNWFFYYLTEVRSVSSSLAGAFTAAQWMVGAVAALIGGWSCDRLSHRFGARNGCRAVAIGGLLLSAPLLVAGTIATAPVLSVALLSLSFGCVQFVDSTFWAATTRIAGAQAQSATGVMNTGGNVAGGIGAMLVPVVAGAFGWPVALASAALFAVLGALLWFGVRADVPLRPSAAPGAMSLPIPEAA